MEARGLLRSRECLLGFRPRRAANALLSLGFECGASPTLLGRHQSTTTAGANTQMEGVQPALTMDDVVESEVAVKKNAQFQAFMRDAYGITDLDTVAVDPW